MRPLRLVDEDLEVRVARLVHASRHLEMVYQPIVNLGTGECTGHEALARFPDGRPPESWFEEAHRLGLGLALEMAAIWRAARRYVARGELSLNLSAGTVTSGAFVDFLDRCPLGFGLVIEITEHESVNDYASFRRALEPIRSRGVRVAVDDAGSGFASMRHVLSIAPDIIKLDCSLVAMIDSDDGRRAFAASLERFAAEVGVELVAEGIEREEERAACQDLGISFGQGFFLGRPARPKAQTATGVRG